MKKSLLSLIILFSLVFLSCSDNDDENSKIKQYEKNIVGIWVPVQVGQTAPSIFIFNKDDTGTIHTISRVSNGIYYVSDTARIKNIYITEVDGTYSNIHDVRFQIASDNDRDWSIRIDYLDTDSLSTMYNGKYKKIPSVTIK